MTDWENKVAKEDPEYLTHKQPWVLDRVKALIQERGKGFTSIEEAQAVAQEALREVNARLKKTLPQRASIQSVASGRTASVPSAPPKTLHAALSGVL